MDLKKIEKLIDKQKVSFICSIGPPIYGRSGHLSVYQRQAGGMGGCGQRSHEQCLRIGGGSFNRSRSFSGGGRREWVSLQGWRFKAIICPGGKAGKGQGTLQKCGKKGLHNHYGSMECRECGGTADGSDSGDSESGRSNRSPGYLGKYFG